MRGVVRALPCKTPARARPPHFGTTHHDSPGPHSLADEDQSGRVEIELALKPGLALLQNVGPILFGGMRGLFLTVRPQRSRKVQIVPTLAVMPCSAARRSCIVSGV